MPRTQNRDLRARDVMRVVPGLKYQTLNYWIASGLVEASAAPGRGRGADRKFTTDDVLAIRLVKELRAAGLSLQSIRKVVQQLRGRNREALRHPLTSTTLVFCPAAETAEGVSPRAGDIAEKVQITDSPEEVLVSLLREPGQGMMRPVVLPLEPLSLETRAEILVITREQRAKLQAKRKQRRARQRVEARNRRAANRKEAAESAASQAREPVSDEVSAVG